GASSAAPRAAASAPTPRNHGYSTLKPAFVSVSRGGPIETIAPSRLRATAPTSLRRPLMAAILCSLPAMTGPLSARDRLNPRGERGLDEPTVGMAGAGSRARLRRPGPE